MFLQVSVCPQGGVHPSGQNPPWANTPRQTSPLDRHPPGETPPWADTPLWADTHPPRQTPQADPPLSEVATAADGTHIAGMHSCWDYFLLSLHV